MVAVIAVPKVKVKNPPLTIHTMGDRVLRQPAKRVSQVNDEIRQMAREMLITMYSSDGVGLAAPQVGIHKRMIVVDPQPDKPNTPVYILINPEIKHFSGPVEVDQEGCLSIPGVYCDVKRYRDITVAYKDEAGRPRQMKASGFLSRIIQHEIDHLEGVLFVDHVENTLVLSQELTQHGFHMQDVQSQIAPALCQRSLT